jgi:hypothetical protein
LEALPQAERMLLILIHLLLSGSERLRERVKIIVLFGITVQIVEVILPVNTAARDTALNRCRYSTIMRGLFVTDPTKVGIWGASKKKAITRQNKSRPILKFSPIVNLFLVLGLFIYPRLG